MHRCAEQTCTHVARIIRLVQPGVAESCASANGSFDLVTLLTAVLAARRADRTGGIARPPPIQGSQAARASVSSAVRTASRAALRARSHGSRDGSSRSASHHRARHGCPIWHQRDRNPLYIGSPVERVELGR
jgi:hypothetical protein